MKTLERVAPPGELTLLFSDIEGSTARWQSYPEAMHACLRLHDEMLHAAIAKHGGGVFKTVGDEFCAIFPSVQQAAGAAIEAQRSLAQQDWSAVGGMRVRMAVHCGPVAHREGDYFGSTVNYVARLLSAAHGGQVLLSGDAARAVLSDTTVQVELRDLGRHRLKDFPAMQPVYQLLAPDLPDVFPPLRTIAERPSNLPEQLQALVGRESDCAQVRGQLQSNRLVSVIGAGGVGKTSIALQTGADVLSEYEDGAWLIELAPVDAHAVESTIASVLGVTSLVDGSLMEALTAQLRTKNALLIVDNCEHVTHAAAQAIDAILRSCAHVRVLATSREPLGIAGEVVYRLPVLAVPPETAVTARDVSQFGSCALFEERARGHLATFAITDANARLLASICRRLDGIPLAIELAAARLRVLTLPQLGERLAERFRLLTGGRGQKLAHHETLRALIDWSYELLSENERVLLRRSALFPGGWTIGAAVDVCAGDTFEEWDILDHLATLVDKSLVIVDAQGDEQRYRMLESTREYALERLDQSSERGAIAGKHAQYFYGLAQRADAAWADVPATLWIAPLEAELDNVRAALSWCQKADEELGIGLFGALEAFWWDAQPMEGRRWSDAYRNWAEQHAHTIEAARYWLATAGIALSLAQEKHAASAAGKALDAYVQLKNEAGAAASRRCYGAALMRLGKIAEGESAAAQALQTFRASGNQRLIALGLRTLAAAAILRSDFTAAAEFYREALPLSQALQDTRGVQIISGNLAEIEAACGNFEQALVHAQEALEVARVRRDQVIVCTLLTNATAYLLELGRAGEAHSMALEALSVSDDIQSEMHATVAIQHLAAVAAKCGDAARAARLLGYVDSAYVRLENSREPTEAREYARAVKQLEERLPAGDLAANLQAGANLNAAQAKSEALLT